MAFVFLAISFRLAASLLRSQAVADNKEGKAAMRRMFEPVMR